MHPAYFFGTVVVVTAILVIAGLILFHWMRQQQSQLIKLLSTVTNLATSKDLQTFQNLQWTTTQSLNRSESPEPVEEIPALDDATVASRLAARYEQMGWDPNMAYNQEDVDFTTEFGLNP